jgi:hypothetical protein
MADLERQGDCFRDNVIRRHQLLGESNVLELSEDIDDPLMVGIPLGDKRKEESCVEEDHAFAPYR